MNVWTSRIDMIGRDPDALDVTRAGAKANPSGPGVPFAPSWDLLLRGKRGELTPAAYGEAYTAEMRASWRRHGDAWRALLARERVVLCCYCADPAWCHRTVLARDVLSRCGATYCGELPTVRALSVRQPWAWALLFAGKDIENRGGPSWARMPLPRPDEWIALHASAGCTADEYRAVRWAMGTTGDIGSRLATPIGPVPALAELPRGGVVGRLRIAERVTASESPWWEGPIGLRVAAAESVPFVRCAGALGLFRVPAWMIDPGVAA